MSDQRIFLIIGACDCVTTAWLNGELLGSHEGGYTPFEFDLTDYLEGRGKNRLVIKVEDKPTASRLVGKQVYGEAKGIWQTVYLEARNISHITKAHFTPDIDKNEVKVDVVLSEAPQVNAELHLSFENPAIGTIKKPIPPSKKSLSFTIPIPDTHLWTLDDPYLYNVDVSVVLDGQASDTVHTYFGMRKIGMAHLPGTKDMYVTLNNEPIFLNMTLDQAYHEEGYYTFPSDDFIREEIERAKKIGLNTIRIHIKVEMPRKLYWADKLGLLVMADVPNIGGEPNEYGRKNWEYTAFNQIDRDYNHPSIFSWVLFNESWGLTSRKTDKDGKTVDGYWPETQKWVKSLYHRVKKIDPTRLVEDNSPDQGRRWHVESDINSWHAYIPGYKWAEYMDMVVKNTYPGSTWNYIEPYFQNDIPMMNSECGNVWGYDLGTGDVDIAYEYHIMLNEYRKRPKICGFLFTEFHDVINEWNGYYRFDRTLKDFGIEELCPGMVINDFHSDNYLIPGEDFKTQVKPGTTFAVPIKASFMSASVPEELTVKTTLHGWNRFGEHKEYYNGQFNVKSKPYSLIDLPPVKVKAPNEECLVFFCTVLQDKNGKELHHNFMPVRIMNRQESARKETTADGSVVLRIAPDDFSGSQWSVKEKSILDGLKVWGTGTGFFEYEFPWPQNIAPDKVAEIEFIAELSARQVQGKDMHEKFVRQSIGDVTTKGIDPGHNPNSYPMTDITRHPSVVTVTLNGAGTTSIDLENDPADHRGILSWLNQEEKGSLSEAGSYGYLVKVPFTGDTINQAAAEKKLRVRLAVDNATEKSGGLAVYGERFGRYPVDPCLVIRMK